MRPFIVLLSLVLASCGSEPPPDGAEPDAGPVNRPDAGRPDAGAPDAGVPCGPASCAGCCDSTGSCRAGTENGACGLSGASCSDCLLAVCVTGRCETPVEPLAGDSCSAPVELRVDSDGFASAALSLTGLADDTLLSCGIGGTDAVVFFDVPSDGTYVELVVSSEEEGVRPLVALRSGCDLSSSESQCNLAPEGAQSARVAMFAQHGRFFAWVEAAGTASAPLRLELRLSPPGPGDTCSAPQALTLSNGAATRRDDLRRYTPSELSCVEGARDAVYTFTLESPVLATLSVSSLTTGFEPALRVGTSCALAGCTASGLETAQFHGLLGSGTHTLIVSSKNLSAGEFELSIVTQPPPSGETCQEAVALTFRTGYASTSVQTAGRSDDFTPSCMSRPPGPDSVFRFRVDQPSDFSASVVDYYDPYTHRNVIALRSACEGVDLGCGSALSIADLSPGDYFLLVDSESSETNPLFLEATITGLRAPGETCARAIPITLSNGAAGGTAQVTGTLNGVGNDVPSRGCSVPANSRDQVYSLTIDQPLIVRASATRLGTTGTLSLHRMSPAGCAQGHSLRCEGGTTATFTEYLPAGTHSFVIESGYEIGYTLDVSATPPTQGEFCADPFVIDLPAGGGTLTHQSTTRGSAQENYNNACMGYDMPDRVYRLTLTDPLSNLRITSTPREGNNAPGMILVSGCDEIIPLLSSCGSDAASTRVLKKTDLPAGTYFLWVKGPTVDGIDYTLHISATPTLPGDTCSVATPVVLSNGPAGGTATLSGTTEGLEDDFYACGLVSPAFPDHVYSVTLDRELNIRVKATPQQASSMTVLTMLEDTCDTFSSEECSYSDASGVAVMRAGSRQPGTHYFSVDHSSGGPGPYSLEISALPHQPGETCSTPLPITFSEGAAGGTVTTNIALGDFFDDPRVDCSGTGTDVFVSFTTDRVLDLRANVQADSSLGIPFMALAGACTGPISCEPSYSASSPFARGSLEPGTHVLALDFNQAPRSPGTVTLQASLTPPTPGDTCAIAIPLSFPAEGGMVQVTGNLADAFDDHRGDCATIYPDRVYTFTTTQTTNLIAEANTSTGLKAPNLTLRSGTCSGSNVVCTYGGDTQSSIRTKALPPGTYFLFVEKSSYDAPNDYSLKVTLGGQPPGDLCASALPLGLPTSGSGQVTLQGDTRPFFDDLVPICGATSGARNAPDTVYTFTTTTVMNLRLYVKALTTGFRPTMSLRRGCGANDFELRCEETPSFSDDTWTSYRELPAGTYYVVIDGYDQSEWGAFELSARLSASELVGEDCSNPEPLTLSQGSLGRATLTRTFPDYFDDYRDCWNFSGSDAVFAVTTDSPRRLHARASGSPRETQPTVSVRRSPCEQLSSQIACERSSYDGTSRVSANLPSGTSYILVKSPLSNPRGTFQLDIEMDDFAPGDICSGAIPLALSGGASGGTASATGDPYTFGPDLSLSCDTSNAPDAFFTFTTDRTLNLSATLTRQDTSAFFSMGLLSGCGGAEVACRTTNFSSAPLILTKSALPAGTHVLVVRGGTSQPSGFTVDVSLTP